MSSKEKGSEQLIYFNILFYNTNLAVLNELEHWKELCR